MVARRHARRVSQTAAAPAASLDDDLEPQPDYELTLTGMSCRRSARPAIGSSSTTRPAAGPCSASSIACRAERIDTQSTSFITRRTRNVLAPQWSPSGDAIVFGIGTFNAFFNGFNGVFLKPGDRAEGGAQIAIDQPGRHRISAS